MSSFDKVTMSLPGGTTFTATGNLQVTPRQQPFYLLDGFQSLRTFGETVGVLDADTSQAFVGNGARVRTFEISLAQWEGSTDSWGQANDDDDVLTKMCVLDEALASANIDGTNPATLEFGEYSSAGLFSPLSVVPGEVQLPVDFSPEGSPSVFNPTLEWRDAADLNQVIHGLAP